MTDLTALPADTTPQAFADIVREHLAQETAPDGPDTTDFHVLGDGGGSWSTRVDGGKIVLDEGASDAPLLALSLAIEDWRAIVLGEVRDKVLAETGSVALEPGLLSKGLAKPALVEVLKGMAGDLQIVIEDGGRAYKVTLTFGGSAPNVEAPTTTISVDFADVISMAKGDLEPQAAFFAGKIRLDGDMNLAMQLMALANA